MYTDVSQVIVADSVFPGTNPNVTEAEIQAEVIRVTNAIVDGDFEEVIL